MIATATGTNGAWSGTVPEFAETTGYHPLDEAGVTVVATAKGTTGEYVATVPASENLGEIGRAVATPPEYPKPIPMPPPPPEVPEAVPVPTECALCGAPLYNGGTLFKGLKFGPHPYYVAPLERGIVICAQCIGSRPVAAWCEKAGPG